MTVEGGALAFHSYDISNPVVMAEALRWCSGRRGADLTAEDAEGANLQPFAEAALTLGAQMLSYGADAGGVSSLAGTVVHLADRAEEVGKALTEGACRATKEVTEAATAATRDAAKITTEALSLAAKQVTEQLSGAVRQTAETMQGELGRLLVGTEAPVAKAVQELVAKQMGESAITMQRTFSETLGTVAATLDVGNPASPLAKLEVRLGERQDRQHGELKAQVKEVIEAVTAASTAAQTAAAVAAVHALSPSKGRPFEENVGTTLEAIATGMGGQYTATGDTTGSIRSCRKGDGVIELPSLDGLGMVRVVVEMTTTGASRKWSTYLGEAERNREAHASIGIVPSTDLVPGGGLIGTVGGTRLVVAYGDDGDPALLRAACVLLALRAQRELINERGGADLAVADARLSEAQALLVTLTEIVKAAVGVKTGAGKVVLGLEGLQESMARCLAQARTALVSGTATAVSGSQDREAAGAGEGSAAA